MRTSGCQLSLSLKQGVRASNDFYSAIDMGANLPQTLSPFAFRTQSI